VDGYACELTRHILRLQSADADDATAARPSRGSSSGIVDGLGQQGNNDARSTHDVVIIMGDDDALTVDVGALDGGHDDPHGVEPTDVNAEPHWLGVVRAAIERDHRPDLSAAAIDHQPVDPACARRCAVLSPPPTHSGTTASPRLYWHGVCFSEAAKVSGSATGPEYPTLRRLIPASSLMAVASGQGTRRGEWMPLTGTAAQPSETTLFGCAVHRPERPRACGID
jgi:hypothetical protein